MMFRIDAEALRVLFTLDARDLALAFVDVEGYCVVDGLRRIATPLPYGASSGDGRVRKRLGIVRAAELEQVSPGVFSYRIRKRLPPGGRRATEAHPL